MVSSGLVKLEWRPWTLIEHHMMFSSWSSTTEPTPSKVGSHFKRRQMRLMVSLFTCSRQVLSLILRGVKAKNGLHGDCNPARI